MQIFAVQPSESVLYKHIFFNILFSFMVYHRMGFPGSSVGKESTRNAGDPGLIPALRRSAGEGISYPLQSSWVSLVAQLVKDLPAMCETWVRSLRWEDPLEKGTATHSSILAWRIPWTLHSTGSQRVRHDWTTFTYHGIWSIILLC